MRENEEIVSIKQSLDQVLKSRIFEKSARARAFLRYIVEEDLAGRADKLKGFSIAVDVFGKDTSFDPATDPLIRVHASRLRELLAKYYDKEGAQSRVRFSIAVGGYKPRYEFITPKINALSQADNNNTILSVASGDMELSNFKESNRQQDQVLARQLKLIWWVLGVIASFIVLIGSIFIIYWPDELSSNAAKTSSPQYLHFLPSLEVFVDNNDSALLNFGSSLTNHLLAYDTVSVLPMGSIEELGHSKSGELAYGVKLERLKNTSSGDDVRVGLVRLVDQQVIRSETYPLTIWKSNKIEFIAASKLTAMTTPEGSLYADVIARGAETPVISCLNKIRVYYDLRNEEKHKSAYRCAFDLSNSDIKYGLITASLGGLMAEAIGRGYKVDERLSVKEDGYQLALKTALMGVDQMPLSARAAREVGFVHSWRNEIPQMIKWFDRANELNKFDTSIGASYGYGRILSGDYKAAVLALDVVTKATTRHPTWWDYYYAIGLLMEGRLQAADNASNPLLITGKSAQYLALKAVIFYELGNLEKSRELVGKIRKKFPKFSKDPQASFRRRLFPEDLVLRLSNALKGAGL